MFKEVNDAASEAQQAIKAAEIDIAAFNDTIVKFNKLLDTIQSALDRALNKT